MFFFDCEVEERFQVLTVVADGFWRPQAILMHLVEEGADMVAFVLGEGYGWIVSVEELDGIEDAFYIAGGEVFFENEVLFKTREQIRYPHVMGG